MSRYVPETIRQFVIQRANQRCEYCLLHQDDAVFSHEIEHIISRKHGGNSEKDNLALACIYCNRNKGADIGTILFPSLDFVRFFNPRIDLWDQHFIQEDGVIGALTFIAEATIKILAINHFERIIERRELIRDNRYPT
ncbi:MAG: HNH endonuclease [Saprospiraceae bacterium]|nr:HNH endonuclease [Saprospiraceae bacterium]